MGQDKLGMISSTEYATPVQLKRRKLVDDSSDYYEPESITDGASHKSQQALSRLKQRRYKFNSKQQELLQELEGTPLKQKHYRMIAEKDSEIEATGVKPPKKLITKIRETLRKRRQRTQKKEQESTTKETYPEE